MTDALRVFELQNDQLDTKYIDEWSEQLGVTDLWKQFIDEAQLP